MKRFWTAAEVESGAQGCAILLDGKPMRLPGGAVLRVASVPLAEALAAEWQAAGREKGGEMSFADTPLTRLAGTAQERVAADRNATADAVARYGETDLLCYRAGLPAALAHRQAQAWQPWLDWAALTYDAPLRIGSGVMHIPQDPQALGALRRAVGAYDANMLAGLAVAVPALGSLILGLAMAEQRLDPSEAHALSVLDETFQTELWGEDAEAAARRRAVGEEVAQAARFMALARAA